jgi:hypothetical protein
VKQMQQIKLNLSHAGRVFSLEITNTSHSPVRIWSAGFSYGYYSIYVQVSPLNGKPCFIRRVPARWTVNIPDFILIEPDSSHVQELDLDDGTWDMSNCEVDLQTEIDISAILEITNDENTTKYDIITGFYESNHIRFKSMSEIIKPKQ